VFYTAFGGLRYKDPKIPKFQTLNLTFFRAVVTADTIQFCAMIFSSVLVSILGTIQMGGLANVFDLNVKGKRLMFFK
jgi:hypothetical protein